MFWGCPCTVDSHDSLFVRPDFEEATPASIWSKLSRESWRNCKASMLISPFSWSETLKIHSYVPRVARSAPSTLQWTYLITAEVMDCLTQLYRVASNSFMSPTQLFWVLAAMPLYHIPIKIRLHDITRLVSYRRGDTSYHFGDGQENTRMEK